MYILQTKNHTFIKEVDKNVVITPNYEEAITYDMIGDAMRDAVKVNEAVGEIIVSVLRK